MLLIISYNICVTNKTRAQSQVRGLAFLNLKPWDLIYLTVARINLCILKLQGYFRGVFVFCLFTKRRKTSNVLGMSSLISLD